MRWWFKLTLTFAVVAVIILPQPAQAQSLSLAERDTIQNQINTLLVQIVLLQLRLEAMQKSQVVEELPAMEVPTPAQLTHQSRIYDRPIEARYAVRSGRLVAPSDGEVRPVDQQLFELLTNTWGHSLVAQYVNEFRVFFDDERDLGAFVETIGGSDEWVVGVNRETYSSDSKRYPDQVERVYQQLFIHELAHVLAYYNKPIVDQFAKEFWTEADRAHAKRVATLSGERRFDEQLAYYQAHTDRFVSDYATVSPDEDLAETFLEYVYADRLSNRTDQAHAKLSFFRDYNDFREARVDIRDRLGL